MRAVLLGAAGIVAGLMLAGCDNQRSARAEETNHISYATAVKCSLLAGRLGAFPKLAKELYDKRSKAAAMDAKGMVQWFRPLEYKFKGYALDMADQMKKTPVQVENDLSESAGLMTTATDNPGDENQVATYIEWNREWSGICTSAVSKLPIGSN